MFDSFVIAGLGRPVACFAVFVATILSADSAKMAVSLITFR